MTLAMLSAVAYAGVLVYAATREAALAPVIGTLGVLGGVLLLFVLVRRHEDLLGWPLGFGGVAYTVALLVHGAHVDEAAPLVGMGLLLCGELATWSLDQHRPIAAERAVVAARAVAVAGLALVGLAISALVVGLAAAPVGGGLAWTVLGALAAVLVVAVAARLARSSG